MSNEEKEQFLIDQLPENSQKRYELIAGQLQQLGCPVESEPDLLRMIRAATNAGDIDQGLRWLEQLRKGDSEYEEPPILTPAVEKAIRSGGLGRPLRLMFLCTIQRFAMNLGPKDEDLLGAEKLSSGEAAFLAEYRRFVDIGTWG